MAWFNIRKGGPSTETPTDLEGLRAMRWPEFESLMAEAFRVRGHAVEKTGKGGLEGDIDLILRKEARTHLVQCKQWKQRELGIAAVREMWGVVAHRGADALKIVSAGKFSTDAAQFAQGKAIELIDGEALLELVRGILILQPSDEVATETAAAPTIPKASADPRCPRCGAAMYKRFSRQTSLMYWGCINYPACKGAQPL